METTLRKAKVSPTALESLLCTELSVQMIDVRSAQEFEEEHIPRSVNIPLEQVPERKLDISPDVDTVLICQSGMRAELCRDRLRNMGIEATVLEGGLESWSRLGYRTVRTRKSGFSLMRQVHLAAGALAFTGSGLALTGQTSWALLPLVVGAGLLLSGSTGFCGMAKLLAIMPWNRPTSFKVQGMTE